jgi:hypothetical protein
MSLPLTLLEFEHIQGKNEIVAEANDYLSTIIQV